MNQSSTKQTNQMKTVNKPSCAQTYTRARAHAPLIHACARETKTLILNAAVIVAVLLGLGAGNVAWGQNVLKLGENLITESDANGTVYTVPANCYISKIECIGGGGGGQSYRSEDRGGRGGGGGGYSSKTFTNGQIGGTVTVKVGAGGSGGTNGGTGTNGGASSVTTGSSTWVIANGGNAGGNQNGNGGTGGTTGGGATNRNGGQGGQGSSRGGGGGAAAAGPNGNGVNGYVTRFRLLDRELLRFKNMPFFHQLLTKW